MDFEVHERKRALLEVAAPRGFELFSRSLFVLGLGWLIACIAPRVASPWPLEWMEGATLQHALRLVQGRALYAPPSAEFTAFVYPPLAYLPMGLAALLFGPQLWVGRAVSLLALALAMLALVRAGRRLGGPAAGSLAAGFYAFGYGYSGGFLDVARVDGVFMALVLWGTERLSAGRTRAAVALFVLACFAKQHGVLFLLAASSWMLWRSMRRRANTFVETPAAVRRVADVGAHDHVGVAALETPAALGELGVPQAFRSELRVLAGVWFALALGVAALQLWSGGWFWTYVWTVPRSHGLAPLLLGSFVAVDLALYLPALCALAGWAVVRRRRESRACDWLLAAALIASALGRAHPGGDDNVRLPAYALFALVAAAGAGEAALRLRGRSVAVLIPLALALQAGMLLQSPWLFWPRADSAQRFEQLRAALQRCAAAGGSGLGHAEGVAPDHAGVLGAAFVHTMAWFDVTRSPGALARRTNATLQARLRASGAPAAVALSEISAPLSELMRGSYLYCADVAPPRVPTGYSPGATRIFRRMR